MGTVDNGLRGQVVDGIRPIGEILCEVLATYQLEGRAPARPAAMETRQRRRSAGKWSLARIG